MSSSFATPEMKASRKRSIELRKVLVIVASWLGLPVSSTHIAVGGVFGVGFYREFHMERRLRNSRAARPEAKRIAPEERRRRNDVGCDFLYPERGRGVIKRT